MPLLTTSLFTNLGLFLAIGAQLTSGAVIPRGTYNLIKGRFMVERAL
jgi:hypothetical protein